MPIIQLTPQLQQNVRMMKRVDRREDANTLLTTHSLSLSKEEFSAAVRTFNRPAHTRQKELVEPKCEWW
ncbi:MULTISPECIES: hypothetical protein [unclassified Paenibacillus]|uniref:hypothetical protein n=1 Tax=unclassified Paenibacillus TaxID=185978 RepID=UPI0027886AD7|nr:MULTISPECIES: hypothetical protein [unclassified Paenibacillus]MDQ0902397.1 hypothetical protein [Paenibacillus sp. V4I7]MDQ0919092.1 hypothetical protein [Paenibacillus sp. V4I5]